MNSVPVIKRFFFLRKGVSLFLPAVPDFASVKECVYPLGPLQRGAALALGCIVRRRRRALKGVIYCKAARRWGFLLVFVVVGRTVNDFL